MCVSTTNTIIIQKQTLLELDGFGCVYKAWDTLLKKRVTLKMITVDCVNAFAKWTGGRLPTEAEWEFAARGGNKSNGYKYSGSNNIDDVAWYWDNGGKHTHQVGTKSPNKLGIYDMSGNVWEWCNDWYDEKYYRKSQRNNPQGPLSGTSRVVRGGSWLNSAELCRIVSRNCYKPDFSSSSVGFRVAR